MADNVTQQHADYVANILHWGFLRHSYEGTGGFRDGAYIEKHDKEAKVKYTNRKRIKHYYNFCAPIIDTYTGHLFKKAPTRITEVNEILDFYIDTARGGRIDINELMKEASTLAHVYGYCFIVIDKPDISAETKRDELINNIKPYAYTLTPEDVIDWRLDSTGALKWIKIKETHILNEDDPLATHDEVEKYRIWDKQNWTLYTPKDDGYIVETTAPHSLGVVPVVIIYNRKGLKSPLPGIAEISDIAYINKRLFNLISELDELLRGQTFSVLTYQTDNSKDLADLELGTDRILTYGADSERPDYISPPATAMQAYEQRIKATIEEIYRLAKLNYTGGVSPSGVALAFEFEKTNQSLKDKAKNLADAEHKIADIVARWQDKEGEVTIDYPQDYNINDMSKELDNIMTSLSLGISDKFNNELKKVSARKILPNLSSEKHIEIDKEIEEGTEIDLTEDDNAEEEE